MIPVLFKANAVDFSTFGSGVLADCISCEVPRSEMAPTSWCSNIP